MNLLIFNLKTDADDSILGFTTDWINALATRCSRIVVITMTVGRLAVAENVAVYSVGKEKGYSEPRRAVEFYRLLRYVLRQESIDVCFAHMMPLFAVLGWPLLKMKGIPILLWYAHSHVSSLLRLATVLVDRVVAPSSNCFRIDTPKFHSVGHGIEVERFSPAQTLREQRKRFVLLTVGRISPIKRLEIVLEAIILLPSDLKQCLEMRFLGAPLTSACNNYLCRLKEKVEDMRLSGIVRFQPAIAFHKVHEAYQGADVFINSSDTDSIDKTVLEAMSCGVPVVTSNSAFKGVLGADLAETWLIAKEDPAVLAQRIALLVQMDQGERLKLGRRLRQIVKKNHSLSALAERVIKQAEICRGEKWPRK